MDEKAVDVTDLDLVYREIDKLYARLARGCGLSDCAYWILYAIEAEGERATQRDIARHISHPKQTVNFATRTLVEKGLVELVPVEGDRRSKELRLTPAGRAFAAERIVPAMEVERRAFESLEPDERREFIRLASKYAAAVLNGMGESL